MKETRPRLHAVLMAFFFVAACILTWQQQINFTDLKKQSVVSRLGNLRPILRETSKPSVVAATAAINALPRSQRMRQSDLKGVEQAILGIFGNGVRLLLVDHHGDKFVSHNFTVQETGSWRSVLRTFYQYHSGGPRPDHMVVDSYLQRELDSNFKIGYLPNYLNHWEGSLAGKHGLLILGNLVDEKLKKRSIGRVSRTISGESFADYYCGSVFIFIPEESYLNSEWIRDNVNHILSDAGGIIFAGDSIHISRSLENAGLPGAAKKFAEVCAGVPFSSFLEENHAFYYNSISGCLDRDAFVLIGHSADMSRTEKVFYHLVVIAFGLVLMTILAVLDCLFTQKLLRPGLARKFLLLAVSACSAPLLLLILQGFSQYQTETIQSETKIYAELEARLSILEGDYFSNLGRLFSEIGLFKEFFETLDDYSDPGLINKIEEKVSLLVNFDMHQFYVADQKGEVKTFAGKRVGAAEDTRLKETTRILAMLLKFIHQSLRFGDNSRKVDVKEGLILEAITEAIGMENLYSIALKNNQLMTFKMLHGAIWILTMVQEVSGNPERILMFIIHRSHYHQRMIDQWQAGDLTGSTNVFFSDQNYSYMRKLAPVSLEYEPGLAAILRTINISGGMVRSRLSLQTGNHYCIARKLKDMDWAAFAVSPESDFAEKWLLNPLILVLSIAYLFVFIFLVTRYFYSIYLLPVRNLSDGLVEMASGNYDLRLESSANDEIGAMCSSFNSMARSLKQKEFLSLFLSDLARDAISGKSTSKATRIEGTVLFSDIRGFTTISEKYPPEAVVTMLNDFMTRMEGAIESESGSIEKFIGDAIMAVFLPSHGISHPAIRAAAAAEKMMQELKEMNIIRSNRGLFTIDIGAGIASGELLMGTLGMESVRREFTVTGQVVLQASAMEKLTRTVGGKKIVLCSYSARFIKVSGMCVKKISELDAFELL